MSPMLLWNMFDSQYGLVFRAKHALCVWRSEHTGVMPTAACPDASHWTGDTSAGGTVSVSETVTGAAEVVANKAATARHEDSSLSHSSAGRSFWEAPDTMHKG